jgi:serine/threonine protein kinase
VLKFMNPRTNDAYRAACFEREVAVSERLAGKDNIIQLAGGLATLDVPLTSALGVTVPYTLRFFALERARESFEAFLLRHHRPRAVYRRLEKMLDVAKGVGRLHRAGYCHRDLKPDNILLFSRGLAKVADLGTCRLHSGVDQLQPTYFAPAGHMMYAAPEMFAGGGMNPSLYIGADWFGVGAIMFEALVGQNLYTAIGLRSPGEIKAALAAASDLRQYLQQIGRAVGDYPIPAIGDFSEPWLEPLRHGTERILTSLTRDLCHFDPNRRLVDFGSIVRRLQIAVLHSRRDHEQFCSKRLLGRP